MDEKERLLLCIQRFDHYYDSINNKGTVYLTLGAFIVSGLIAFLPLVSQPLKEISCLRFLYTFSFLIGLTCMIITLVATAPFLSRGNSSILYFGSIADSSLDKFIKDSKKYDSKSLKDLRAQTHDLSIGLKKKFSHMYWVSRLFIIQFVLLVILGIALTFNI